MLRVFGGRAQWNVFLLPTSIQCSPLQGGNNNTYCHDSPLNWIDWQAAEDPGNAFARFFRLLVALRQDFSTAPPPDVRATGSSCRTDLLLHSRAGTT